MTVYVTATPPPPPSPPAQNTHTPVVTGSAALSSSRYRSVGQPSYRRGRSRHRRQISVFISSVKRRGPGGDEQQARDGPRIYGLARRRRGDRRGTMRDDADGGRERGEGRVRGLSMDACAGVWGRDVFRPSCCLCCISSPQVIAFLRVSLHRVPRHTPPPPPPPPLKTERKQKHELRRVPPTRRTRYKVTHREVKYVLRTRSRLGACCDVGMPPSRFGIEATINHYVKYELQNGLYSRIPLRGQRRIPSPPPLTAPPKQERW